MSVDAGLLPSRKWSIVALGTAGMVAVIVSYALALGVAVAFLCLPLILFAVIPLSIGSMLFARVLLSAFGLVAGFTILWSLLPRRDNFEVNGIPIDLSKEKRLARYIEEIAAALHEPMPSEVYLLGEANAFVAQPGGFMGLGSRRIMGLGLPLLQMLTISQFRAVLAHEFAHYYAGDTRLGPWVYNTRRAIARVYENLGKKSDVISFLTRWAVVAAPYMVLMGAMRVYWKVFMRITQSISRQQEYRSDELACHLAGSQPLVDGLKNIHRCQAALRSYWNSIVLPVAANGFQPQVADGFQRFMNAPQIAKATSDSLAKQIEEATAKPFDTHPPLSKRIERAQLYSLPAPNHPDPADGADPPMISLIDGLDSLEAGLLKKFVPALAKAELRPLSWEMAGTEFYVPAWRKQIAGFTSFLSTKTLSALPGLVTEPRAISDKISNPPGMMLNKAQREARALDVLSSAVTLSLLDNGWKLLIQPGTFYLESDGAKLEPGAAIAAIKSAKLTAQQWETDCSRMGIGAWPLASSPSGDQAVVADA